MSERSPQSPTVRLPEERAGTVRLDADLIGDAAPISVRFESGAYPLTAASRITLSAVARSADELAGVGIDWGCGTGCLAITAARLPRVERVIGLDVVETNVRIARENVLANEANDAVTILHADSYRALDPQGERALDAVRGHVTFVVANPPASPGDDGFEFRRRVVREAAGWLAPDAVFLIQVSVQYGEKRVMSLLDELPGLAYEGCVASTPWVPFEQSRPDLRYQLVAYAEHETEGGQPYAFGDPRDGAATLIDARTALAVFEETGASPLSRWQVHRFRWHQSLGGNRA